MQLCAMCHVMGNMANMLNIVWWSPTQQGSKPEKTLTAAANIRLEKTVFRFISQTRRQTESIFRIQLWVPPPFDARFDAINELSRTKGSLFYSSLM